MEASDCRMLWLALAKGLATASIGDCGSIASSDLAAATVINSALSKHLRSMSLCKLESL